MISSRGVSLPSTISLTHNQMAAWEFQCLQNIAERNGWHKFIFFTEEKVVEVLHADEFVPAVTLGDVLQALEFPGCHLVIPWSPIARGALARPWGSRGTVRENSDGALKMFVRLNAVKSKNRVLTRVRQRPSDSNLSHAHTLLTSEAIIDRVEELASKKGVSMAQIAIAWSLTHPGENPRAVTALGIYGSSKYLISSGDS
jgi:versiconal hemiacetal acetate reductase